MKKILLFIFLSCLICSTADAKVGKLGRKAMFQNGFSATEQLKTGNGDSRLSDGAQEAAAVMKLCNPDCDECDYRYGKCLHCNASKYLKNGNCLACPANATCNGSTFTCNTGFISNGSSCSNAVCVDSDPQTGGHYWNHNGAHSIPSQNVFCWRGYGHDAKISVPNGGNYQYVDIRFWGGSTVNGNFTTKKLSVIDGSSATGASGVTFNGEVTITEKVTMKKDIELTFKKLNGNPTCEVEGGSQNGSCSCSTTSCHMTDCEWDPNIGHYWNANGAHSVPAGKQCFHGYGHDAVITVPNNANYQRASIRFWGGSTVNGNFSTNKLIVIDGTSATGASDVNFTGTVTAQKVIMKNGIVLTFNQLNGSPTCEVENGEGTCSCTTTSCRMANCEWNETVGHYWNANGAHSIPEGKQCWHGYGHTATITVPDNASYGRASIRFWGGSTVNGNFTAEDLIVVDGTSATGAADVDFTGTVTASRVTLKPNAVLTFNKLNGNPTCTLEKSENGATCVCKNNKCYTTNCEWDDNIGHYWNANGAHTIPAGKQCFHGYGNTATITVPDNANYQRASIRFWGGSTVNGNFSANNLIVIDGTSATGASNVNFTGTVTAQKVTMKKGIVLTFNQLNGNPTCEVENDNGTCTCTAKKCSTQSGGSCDDGYYWDEGSSSCKACSTISVANGSCTACSAEGQCTMVSCNNTYYPTEDFSGCRSCSTISVANGSCRWCGYSYTMSGNQMIFGSGNCSLVNCNTGYYGPGDNGSNSGGVSNAHCQSCSQISVANGTCTACSYTGTGTYSNGHYTYAGSCSAVSCNSGYYKSGTQCKACSTISMGSNTTCTSCNSNGSCTAVSCASGYYPSGTQCKACSTISVGSYGTCTNCNDKGVCTNASCKVGYNFSGGQCISGYGDQGVSTPKDLPKYEYAIDELL